MKRQSGVLLPVFSLPNRYGCGNFGESARRWIDILKEGGFSCWQVLPFGVTDDYNSPYMSFSSFAGNPYYIDPEELHKQGLVTWEELSEQTFEDPYLCQYKILKEKRFDFYKKAAMRVQDRSAVLSFMNENPAIEKACEFLSLNKINNERTWQDWDILTPDPDDLFTWQFIQYEFHRQWKVLHNYAKEQGISIIGDLPFYVSHNSSDVWTSPEQFMLDEKNFPDSVAGVPPDYFCEDGQKWGNPLYNWDVMEADGFSWWKTRMSYILDLFDGVRIDHFRAISSYWSVPAEAETAKFGEWKQGPGEKLIDALKPLTKDKLVLAEDLGIIDDGTRELLKYSGYPGMAVFQFGFDGDPRNTHLPHNYIENLTAYTGTHDNNTLLGFWWECDELTRKTALDYLGNPQDSCAAVIRALMMSRARIVIFPVQDLLGYGADTRINTPGKATGNWCYRLSRDQMESVDRKHFAHLNHIYAR